MKSKSLFSIVLLIPNLLYAYEPSGRGYDPDAPFLGLPSGDEVWNGLVIGIIALLIGYLILNARHLYTLMYQTGNRMSYMQI